MRYPPPSDGSSRKPGSLSGLRGRWFSLALSLVLPLSTQGQESRSTDKPAPATSLAEYSGILWGDVSYVATAPGRWEGKDWMKVGAASAAVVGTGLLLDRPVHNYTESHQGDGLNRLANHFEKFGAEYSFGVLGAFYAEGMVDHDPLARVTAEDGLSASILTSRRFTGLALGLDY